MYYRYPPSSPLQIMLYQGIIENIKLFPKISESVSGPNSFKRPDPLLCSHLCGKHLQVTTAEHKICDEGVQLAEELNLYDPNSVSAWEHMFNNQHRHFVNTLKTELLPATNLPLINDVSAIKRHTMAFGYYQKFEKAKYQKQY